MKQSGIKSFIFGILLLGFVFSLSVSNAHAQWAYTYGGTGSNDFQSVKQTSDGGYIMAGGTRILDDVYAWIVKVDDKAAVTWQKAYGGANGDSAQSIQQLQDGGYIVAGRTNSFGTVNGDVWVLRLDAAGELIWQKSYGGAGDDYPFSVQQTLPDGGYIIAGWTNSFGAGNFDMWLLRLDSDGNIMWQKTYGGTGYDEPADIIQTGDGGFIVAGYTGSFKSNDYDTWLLKLDSDGNIVWQKIYGGDAWEWPTSVATTSDNGYIVGGVTQSFGAGLYDAWMLKLASDGTVVWQKAYGGNNNDYTYSTMQTSDGGYILGGTTASFGEGNRDTWIMKLDANGAVTWQKTFGGTADDFIKSVQQTREGEYVAAGYTFSFGSSLNNGLFLNLDRKGSMGSCPFENISAASITNTSATIADTSITPITSTATVSDTTATVTDTTVSPGIVCSSSGTRLKVGFTRKSNGDGTITSLDDFISCPDTCEAFYFPGVTTTLTATPSDLSTFLGWKPASLGCEGTDPCQVTMDKKKSVKAVFQGPNKLKVVTTFKNEATGTVTSGDALINCPGDCEELYILNAPVTLTANAGPGSTFVKWTGTSCKDELTNVCTFEMNKNVTVKAIFEPNP